MSRGSMASPRVLKAQITDITCGENVTIIEPSNVYGQSLKMMCSLALVEIQKNSVIGNRSKIQSHTFICEYVTISDCFVGQWGDVRVNDLFKDAPVIQTQTVGGRTVIANNVTIGSNATVLSGQHLRRGNRRGAVW
ncbi:N-acetyltransferase [Vibrio lentus]|nr:N-acetyltransferase [Vibrio lentus]